MKENHEVKFFHFSSFHFPSFFCAFSPPVTTRPICPYFLSHFLDDAVDLRNLLYLLFFFFLFINCLHSSRSTPFRPPPQPYFFFMDFLLFFQDLHGFLLHSFFHSFFHSQKKKTLSKHTHHMPSARHCDHGGPVSPECCCDAEPPTERAILQRLAPSCPLNFIHTAEKVRLGRRVLQA